ncbi:type II secretion system protein C [Sphingopyxis lindanitolerans]|uniref:Type II secretion system protein C n=1 Tax=Sphingopyxis lindanitolerans TaxID=2054227 RepID=A0A2S8B317_9SPHN|nr:type II secretion system protein N [Sphingopyxis lindanitolerans]PQM26757.1 type II secretion system protein C [Sphingopyxis lindanitolerans]
MAVLMTGSAVRLPRALPSWLRVGKGAPREALPLLLVGLLGALLIWQCVRLFWTLVVPLSPLGAWQPQTAVIASPAERRALFSSIDPFFRTAPQGPASATVTALGLTLFGVNLNEATGGGSAIIAGEDGVQASYAVGDEVAPGVTLAGVAFDHVLLDRAGTRESLFLDQSGEAPVANPALPAPTPEIGSTAAPPSGEMSPAALKAGVGFAPRTENGKITGLVVQPQGDGAVFRAAGLKPGDVVRSVNGRPISSAGDAAALANQFTPGARLSIEVERGASVVPVAILLAKQ